MFQLFRHGIEISRHHLKGVYVLATGKHKSESSEVSPEIICSIREGYDACEEWDKQSGEGDAPKYEPITLSYLGTHVTLRPWDPYSCVIAAGIHNRLIHFPIRPGTRIFALDCSMQSLSHIADTVGPSGHLIGVIGDTHPQQPSDKDLNSFSRRHRSVLAVKSDVQSASLENYERLLSIPQSSKYAFLMGKHSRLGEKSPIQVLKDAPQSIFARIFDFLECHDPAKVKCLVICHWPENTKVETIRDVVLTHIEIFQQWRRHDETAEKKKKEDGAASSNSSGEDETSAVAHTAKEEKEAKKSKKSKSDSEAESHWVLIDVPTDKIQTEASTSSSDVNNNLTEVVDCMKRVNGLRTGLFAKEQLLLRPYFSNHALLLTRYVASRDERKAGVPRRSKSSKSATNAATTDKAAADGEAPPKEKKDKSSKPPASASVPLPMPSFLGAAGGAPPGLPEGAPPPPPPGLVGGMPSAVPGGRTPGPVAPSDGPHQGDDGRSGLRSVTLPAGQVPGGSPRGKAAPNNQVMQLRNPAKASQQKQQQQHQQHQHRQQGYDRNQGYQDNSMRMQEEDVNYLGMGGIPSKGGMPGGNWWPTEGLGLDPSMGPPFPPPPPGLWGGGGGPGGGGGGFQGKGGGYHRDGMGGPHAAPVGLGNQWSNYPRMHGSGSQHGMNKGRAPGLQGPGLPQRRQGPGGGLSPEQLQYMHHVGMGLDSQDPNMPASAQDLQVLEMSL